MEPCAEVQFSASRDAQGHAELCSTLQFAIRYQSIAALVCFAPISPKSGPSTKSCRPKPQVCHRFPRFSSTREDQIYWTIQQVKAFQTLLFNLIDYDRIH